MPRKFTRKRNSTRPRRTLYSNSAKVIYTRFIKPLVNSMALGYDDNIFVESIARFFVVKTRTVLFCKAKEGFSVPGKSWSEHPNVIEWGALTRQVKKGSALVVRYDELMPNRAELEYGNEIFIMPIVTLKSLVELKMEVVC